ncbi:MAG: hypothetical protein ACRDP6_32905 [Actinoallomurus sp.]
MVTRTGPDYPSGADDLFAAIEHEPGDEVTTGRYPVIQVNEAWELASVLESPRPA